MLNAFRQQLIELSRNPRDPYTTIIRRLVGARSAVRFENPIRQMVLALPDMIQQVRTWSEEPGQSAGLKRFHSFVLRYLYHPTDFLSERNLGFFGYVDDAYVVAKVYLKTLDEREWGGVKPLVDQPELAKSIPAWTELTRQLLSKETTNIDQMLDELKFHSDNGFHWAIKRASNGTSLSRKLEKEVYQ